MASLPKSDYSTDDGQHTEIEHPSAAVKETAVRHGAGDGAVVSPLKLSFAPLEAMRQLSTTGVMFQAVETESAAESVGPQSGGVPATPEPSAPDSTVESSRQRIQTASRDRHPLARTLPDQTLRTIENDATAQNGRGGDVSLPAHKGLDERAAFQLVPQPLQSIVQQQLEAFATQHFSWQGQIWPGQQMHWEIDDQSQERDADGKPRDGSERWQTRLRLILPKLGEVDARLQIHDRQMTLTLYADSAETRVMLHNQGGELHQQLENVGLTLATLGVVQPSD